MVVTTYHAALGASGDPNAGETWLPGGARWGTAGTHRVVAGHAWPSRGFGVTLGGNGSWAQDVLGLDDSAQAYQGYLDIVYQPIERLEIALGGRVDFFADSAFVGSRVLRIGSPELILKYAFKPVHGVGMALMARGFVPVAEQTFALGQPAIGLTGAASWRFLPHWQLNLNLGGAYDRTGNAVGPGWRNPAQKVADGLVHTSYAMAGLSVNAAWVFEAAALDTLTVIPFAELTGEFGFGVGLSNDPTRLTLGCKAMIFDERPLEVMLGVDRRLTGAPAITNPFPGELPWTLLVKVAMHVDQVGAHAKHFVDRDHLLREVHESVVTAAARGPEVHAVVVHGDVMDNANQPIPEGMVVIDNRVDAPLALERDGTFSTLPVVIQGNVLHVQARAVGYKNVDQNVLLTANQNDVHVHFQLPFSEHMSVVRGTIFNKRTGKPLPHASVFVPSLGSEPLKVDAHGGFALPMHDGRYQIIFSAPGFASVKRQLVIESEVRVILNIGLSHKLPSVLRR